MILRHRAKNTLVVYWSNGLIFFLAGSVPDLELNRISIDGLGFGDECSSEGRFAKLVKLIIGISKKYAAFSNA